MKVLVTGAGGFLGTAVLRAARAARLEVRAMVRTPPAAGPDGADDAPEVVVVDLRDRGAIAAALDGVDVVVHLAATKAGGFAEQFAGTVTTTEHLVAAMELASVRRIVHVSSFSVYDPQQLRSGGVLDERAPTIDARSQRDEYAHTKWMQERLLGDFSRRRGVELIVLRPGIVYGAGELWNSHLGVEINDRLWLQVGSAATVPITYVDNCADAIVRAVVVESLPSGPLNIVDDDLPTQRQFREAIGRVLPATPRMIPVPWTAVRLMTKAYARVNQRLSGGRAQPPGLFREAVVHARFKPLRYPNDAAKRALGWTPRCTFAEALRRIATDTAPATGAAADGLPSRR